MFVDGAALAPRPGRRPPVVNPVDGEAFDDVPLASAADIHVA